jgi:transcriptional regulator with XRE-family HTH domain
MQAGLNLAMSRPLESLAQRLVHARKKRRLNQEQLAEAAGLKQPDVSKLETGRMLKTTAMARLARALGVPSAWLEFGEGREPDWNVKPAEDDASRPAPPPRDFRDRHVVSDSDWALLQDIKDAMASPSLAKQVEQLRSELAAMKQFAESVYQRRIREARNNGGHAGGLSLFDESHNETTTKSGKKHEGGS